MKILPVVLIAAGFLLAGCNESENEQRSMLTKEFPDAEISQVPDTGNQNECPVFILRMTNSEIWCAKLRNGQMMSSKLFNGGRTPIYVENK